LGFFEKTFEKMQTIFIFRVKFGLNNLGKKCKRFSYFAKLGFFEKTLEKPKAIFKLVPHWVFSQRIFRHLLMLESS
jgi:hypothetical protein